MTQQHLLDRVLARFPEIGETAARVYLNNAIDEFCDLTGINAREFQIISVADQTEYPLDADLVRASRVELPGTDTSGKRIFWKIEEGELIIGELDSDDEIVALAAGTDIRIHARSKVADLSEFVRLYDAELSGAISATADNGSGEIRATDVAHGLVTGNTIVVAGFVTDTSGNGTQTVTKIDDDTFDIDGSTWSVDESTATWTHDSEPVVDSEGRDVYVVGSSLTDTPGIPEQFHDAPIFRAMEILFAENGKLNESEAMRRLWERKLADGMKYGSIQNKSIIAALTYDY